MSGAALSMAEHGAPASVALEAAMRETVRMSDGVEHMLRGPLQVLLQHDTQSAARLRSLVDEVNARRGRMHALLCALGTEPALRAGARSADAGA